MMTLTGKCPYEFYCDDGSHGFSVLNGTSLRLLPSFLGIVSATLSLLGSLLILCAYCAFKNLRKGSAPTIITALALADAGSSLSLLIGIFNFLVYDHYHSGTVEHRDTLCLNFYTVCQIQAFVMAWFAISSYIWASVLAIHFLLSTALSRSYWSDRLMPLYTVVAWTLPLVFLLPLLITGKLGYAPTYLSTCYISAEAVHDTSKVTSLVEQYVSWSTQAAFGVITIVCYVIILVYICSKRRQLHSARRIAIRLLAIPVVYLVLLLLVLLMWLPVQASNRGTSVKEPLACSNSRIIQMASYVISTLQVTFSFAGQGWINCILYIFLSPDLRRRMFVLPFKRCLQRCERHRPNRINVSSEVDPLIDITRNAPSTQAKARERGSTYFSFPIDMPEAV